MVDTDDIDLIVGPHRPPHVYIHVPFCLSKCSYCDFASIAGADSQTVEAVFAGLRSDIRNCSEWALPGVVETLYVGGGTPTHVARDSIGLVRFAVQHLPLREAAEITVEANPESLSAETAQGFAQAGATRMSLGVQSFDDRVLRILGRPHDAGSARRACEAVSRSGMELSVDLMCGIPKQSMASWQESLDSALRTGARHISVYPLAVEDGTPLAVAIDTGLLDPPDPDTAADMMLLAERVLSDDGFTRYEVASYARPGAESLHNTAYWTGGEYLGMGPSAHGMLDSATALALGLTGPGDVSAARVRYSEAEDIDSWLTGPRIREIELLSAEETRREDVMLGLRLTRGVEVSSVRAAGLAETLEGLAADGLVTLDEEHGRWMTTRRGWLLGNEVFRRVWTAD
jgi:oxygen-independent coproporphyrinogen-3 oxidase